MQNGERVPLFSLPDLDGIEYHLSEDLGKIVVINFWSAECPWSERVDRSISPFLSRWGARVAWLTVAANASEPFDLLCASARARQLRVLHDVHQAVADLYGGETTPHLFVIDAGGFLRYQGAFDDVTFRRRLPTQAYVVEAVEALLAGRLPAVPQSPPYGCTIVRSL